jgi:putative DNA primase/helicase
MTERRRRCPHCGRSDSDKTMSVNVETGLYCCHRCQAKGKEKAVRSASVVLPLNASQFRRRRIKEVWAQTRPLTDRRGAYPQRHYLASRGLADVLRNPPQDLRAHPALDYWENGRVRGTFPALVAPLRAPNGDIITLHTTFLRGDGGCKADVPSPKRVLAVPVEGSTRGAAIHLYEPTLGTIGIGEGIETALSLHLLHNIPVWSAFAALGLERVILPTGLRTIYIAVDLDPVGEAAAQALAARLQRLKPAPQAFFVRPDNGKDLNDELRRKTLG